MNIHILGFPQLHRCMNIVTRKARKIVVLIIILFIKKFKLLAQVEYTILTF